MHPTLRHLAAAALLMAAAAAHACDPCGCAASPGFGGFMGTGLQFQRNFVGLRAHAQHFRTATVRDQVWGAELTARTFIRPAWQLMATLPHSTRARRSTHTGARATLAGIGDLRLAATARLWQSPDTARTLQRLYLSAGASLPTGRRHAPATAPELAPAPNAMPGTGAWTPALAAQYLWQRGHHGLTAYAQAQRPAFNAQGYRLGHSLGCGLRAFARWQRPGWQAVASAGADIEAAAPDYHRGTGKAMQVLATGGQAAYAALGLDWYRGRWAIMAQARQPVHQHLARGEVRASLMAQLGCSWSW